MTTLLNQSQMRTLKDARRAIVRHISRVTANEGEKFNLLVKMIDMASDGSWDLPANKCGEIERLARETAAPPHGVPPTFGSLSAALEAELAAYDEFCEFRTLRHAEHPSAEPTRREWLQFKRRDARNTASSKRSRSLFNRFLRLTSLACRLSYSNGSAARFDGPATQLV